MSDRPLPHCFGNRRPSPTTLICITDVKNISRHAWLGEKRLVQLLQQVRAPGLGTSCAPGPGKLCWRVVVTKVAKIAWPVCTVMHTFEWTGNTKNQFWVSLFMLYTPGGPHCGYTLLRKLRLAILKLSHSFYRWPDVLEDWIPTPDATFWQESWTHFEKHWKINSTPYFSATVWGAQGQMKILNDETTSSDDFVKKKPFQLIFFNIRHIKLKRVTSCQTPSV